ncbi:MAG: UDP-N-acetylmuramate dehydrogenase [Alphaproteobacteria bacterium]|nr:UDP-N-acetylmuramate dehydrogenase [Alphaproteobacteria bacterium]
MKMAQTKTPPPRRAGSLAARLRAAGRSLGDDYIRGKIQEEAPLNRHSWFRVGGPAEVLFSPDDKKDLINFLKILPPETPLTVLGLGSNMLIRDGGVRGAVVRLWRAFGATRYFEDDKEIYAEAAAPCPRLAKFAYVSGLGGLEFYLGIPGTVGGAIVMNAGAFGGETKKVISRAYAVLRNGDEYAFTPKTLHMRYRYSRFPKDAIFIAAKFSVKPERKGIIKDRMDSIRQQRDLAQPTGIATGGSTFKNPPKHKAWRLIEEAGCQNLRVGAARVSEKHCNFLVNEGGATATDIEALGEEIRRRVFETSGKNLEWEIRRIGQSSATDDWEVGRG